MSETLTKDRQEIITATAMRIIDNWCEWDAEAGQAAQVEQNNDAAVAVLLGHLERELAAIAAPPPDLSALARGLRAVAELIDASDGVAGLHLNGDVAPWDELRSGGRFEEWLAPFDEALSRLTPAAGVDALYPDNLNADLAHRLSCVAHDCCVNGRMRHDVGLKLVRVVRDFMRPVHSPAALEVADSRELIERASMTHGCKNCGEERPATIHNGRLCCPECLSYNLVCLD